jgi:transposase InsO family protein
VKRVLAGHGVAMVAQELGIGESLLHNWVTRHRLMEGTGALQAEQAAEITRLKRALAWKEEEAAIQRRYDLHKGRYGAPRLTKDLHAEGWRVSRRRVAKRMQAMGLKAKAAKKYKATTQSKHSLPLAPNLLERDFTAPAASQKWVSDITDIWTEEGWLYLAVVLDLYSRAVVGWAMAERMTRELVIAALTMAVWRRRPEQSVCFGGLPGSLGTPWIPLQYEPERRLLRQRGDGELLPLVEGRAGQ